ncbi:hypothetical protein EVAR_60247_1 [Eumeta japonica]|uniref:Uncharacterized protein n=1 Tax=Eumeta variegata TaxID=151549 RepID=A0A4C1Z9Z7_EUMVA|nr:hypothetical protein EVAR_60247_1 [Eumeta japonica]
MTSSADRRLLVSYKNKHACGSIVIQAMYDKQSRMTLISKEIEGFPKRNQITCAGRAAAGAVVATERFIDDGGRDLKRPIVDAPRSDCAEGTR